MPRSRGKKKPNQLLYCPLCGRKDIEKQTSVTIFDDITTLNCGFCQLKTTVVIHRKNLTTQSKEVFATGPFIPRRSTKAA